jgi:tryptophan-rich sensory protein
MFSPIIYIIIPILFACIINFIIFTHKYKQVKNAYLPPGYIIGIIWIIIFGLLGYAYYLLSRKSHNKLTLGMISIIGVIFFSLWYPFLTQRFSNILVATWLNRFTLLLSVILGSIVYLEYVPVFIYIIPLILWSLYVNVVF